METEREQINNNKQQNKKAMNDIKQKEEKEEK